MSSHLYLHWQARFISLRAPKRALIILFLMTIGTFSLCFYGLVAGSKILFVDDIWLVFNGELITPFKHTILRDVRIPRILTALFAGAALGISGGVFQTILRNPLGSPDVLGLSAGSACGVIYCLMFVGQSALLIISSALLGGIVTAGLLYFLALRRHAQDSFRLILIGIGIGAIATAINGLMLVKGDLDKAMLATLWMAGSLDGKTWQHVWFALLPLLLVVPVLSVYFRAINVIEIGDSIACSLGINVAKTRLVSLLSAVLLLALATAAVGPIAFIALIAPQLANKLMRTSGFSLVGSALMGSTLLLSADVILQSFSLDAHFPVGRMTAAIAGFYLLWFLAWPMRNKNASR